MVGVSGEVGKGRGVWDVISFWTGREQEDGSSFLRRMSGVGMEEGAGGGGVQWQGKQTPKRSRDLFGNPSSELSSWWILSLQT